MWWKIWLNCRSRKWSMPPVAAIRAGRTTWSASRNLTSFYLRWHPHHLAQRLALTDLNERPLLHGKNAEEILSVIMPQLMARIPYYEQADYIIDAPASLDSPLDGTEDEQLADILYDLVNSSAKIG